MIIIWDKVWMFVAVLLFTYLSKKITTSEPNKIKFHFYYLMFYFCASLLACIIWPFFLWKPKDIKNAQISARILSLVTKLYKLKWELRRGEILSEDQGAVIVANHQSALDILGMFNIWDVIGKLAPVAKKEIFYVWPMGLVAYLAGVVFIDRKNSKDAYETLKSTSEVMVKNKTKIWIFPEGTRKKDRSCNLLPFKKGAFVIAVSSQKPIIPIVYSPYYFIDEKKYIFDSGHIVIQCLDPIKTEGLKMEDIPELMERVKNQMEKTYKELTKEILTTLPPDYPHSLEERREHAKLVHE
ncbi:1-acyl-sn-glycerol-3-phosphate acyltransferase alpha-like [Maniola jurtina]|uniref:1-acyl-sn-glycerol-3-phosphate acyltransferase alpha-like n=1 Tax=Maniola jurtina TaxID=191418 RepID=UPI001E689722|nr:1-acyl-sn-glycerol-3-phosphate acyltransferase alpha-like [Maniola jurtina]